MGPNALWLIEDWCESSADRAGDQSSGSRLRKGHDLMPAEEFGAEVWATDLSVEEPLANQARIREAGVERLVVPIHAEAHALPLGLGDSDKVVSVDAYQYLAATEIHRLREQVVAPDGSSFGAVMPAVFRELCGRIPEELAPFWDWVFCCFHGPDWSADALWRRRARFVLTSLTPSRMAGGIGSLFGGVGTDPRWLAQRGSVERGGNAG